jgi:heptosyltransferase-1
LGFDLQFRLNDAAETPPLKVLIVRVGAMGDVLHGLPAVAALREKIPDCFIGWAVEPRWSALLVASPPHLNRDKAAIEMGHPIVNRIHPVPTREWKRRPFSFATLREIATLRREMMAEKYDLCIDLQGSIRSAVIGRMAQAQHFLGSRRPAERQARALYGERVSVEAVHVIEQACELIGAALTDSWDPVEELRPVRVTLPVDAEAEAWADGKLAELSMGEDGFVLLAPTAGWGAKQWPVERYRALAARLDTAGYTVLVNAGSKADLAVTQAVAADAPAQVVECGLAQLIALTRRAKLVVGGDTGPVHLAAALGRPVVGLYGPTDPRRNGPYFPGSRVRVLRHASSRLDHARHAQTEPGLAKITEDEVIAAAFGLLGEAKTHG